MRTLLLHWFCGLPFLVHSQFPPIDLEWTALRPFGTGDAQIATDPVQGDHLWAVQDDIMLFGGSDEMLYPILADGTDLAPAYPFPINVGGLDGLIDLELYDGATYWVIRHQNIGGNPQDLYWHLMVGGNDLTIQSPEPELEDVAHDLLVNAEGVFIAGWSRTATSVQCRLIHTDLAGNMLWDSWWDPVGTGSYGQFTSVALKGDTVVAISHPLMVMFDKLTGTLLGQLDYTINASMLPPGAARCALTGQSLYWIVQTQGALQYGHYDIANAVGNVVEQVLAGPFSTRPSVAFDDLTHVWFGYSHNGQGHWIKADQEALPIDSGTLYGSINDMRCVNGKLCITGALDTPAASTYVISGTPQP